MVKIAPCSSLYHWSSLTFIDYPTTVPLDQWTVPTSNVPLLSYLTYLCSHLQLHYSTFPAYPLFTHLSSAPLCSYSHRLPPPKYSARCTSSFIPLPLFLLLAPCTSDHALSISPLGLSLDAAYTLTLLSMLFIFSLHTTPPTDHSMHSRPLVLNALRSRSLHLWLLNSTSDLKFSYRRAGLR